MKKLFAISLLLFGFVSLANAEVITGNPKGSVTVVKYYDYQCPHCRTMSSTIDALTQDHDVKVVSRVLAIMSPESWYSARAVLASRKQGLKKYEAFEELMMAQRRYITVPTVNRLASEAGLNLKRLRKDMAAPAITKEIKANMANATENGVHLVPTVLISRSGSLAKNKRFVGETDFARLRGAVGNFRG